MAQNIVTLQETLVTLVQNKKYAVIKEILSTMEPSDIAPIFDDLADQDVPILFRLLSKDCAAETFVEMDPENQELLIKSFSDTELKLIVDDLYVDDAVDIIEDMPSNVVKRILKQASPDVRKQINEILKYPEDSAGSVMTTEFVALRETMTVAEAFDMIRDTGVDKETIYTCYVRKNNKLAGTVSAKDLMLAKNPQTKIKDLMDENVIAINVHADQEEAAKMIKQYDLMALPVVDSDNFIVGIITFDDIMDVLEEEATEDMAIMAAVTPPEKTYLHSSAFEVFKQRFPWLLLLMVSSTFTALIINHFEAALAAQAVLTAFIPMLMGTGGNSGSQASVTIIRSLSLGEIEFNDLPKVILKEFLISSLCGLALAICCFAKVYFIDRMLMHNDAITVSVALVISASMFITVMFAKLIGGILPLIAKKCGADPAVMSAPFITTIVDAMSLVFFFKVASAALF